MRPDPVITEPPQRARQVEGPASEPIAGDFFRDSDQPSEQAEIGTSYLEKGQGLDQGQGAQSWQRWREIQSTFVDDPQNAVSEAQRLVSELIGGIVEQFQGEERELEGRRSSGEQVSTEDLRVSLQRYRDLFGRLLPTRKLEHSPRHSGGD